MQAVILAGGLGTRLRPITETIPKAMAPVRGRPFLEYKIEVLEGKGIDNVIICLAYLGHMIEDHFGDGRRFDVTIRYGYEQDGLLGTAGAVKNVEALLADAFFVQYGDSYLLVDYRSTMAHFRAHDGLGLMVVHKNHDRWDRSNVVVDGGLIRAYDKQRRLPGMVYIDFGVSVFRREVFVDVPLRVATDLAALHRSLIEQGQLVAYETYQRFYEVGSPQGLREFEALAQSGTLDLLTRSLPS